MIDIIRLITTSSSQIFGALFGFQIVMIIIDIMDVKDGKKYPWLGEEWIKKCKTDIKKRLQKIIIIIVILIIYVIIANLIFKNY